MRCNYLEQDYEARLNGGVVFFKKKPVYVYATNSGKIELFTFPDNERIGVVHPQDENLDISAPKLGFVNIGGKAVYCYRRPLRQYKQSLQVTAITTFTPMRKEVTSAGDIFNTKQFADMLIGKYPNMDAALKFVREKKRGSMAFNRNMCVSRDSFDIYHVFFKTEEIGIIEDVTSKVITVPSSQMMKITNLYLPDYTGKIG